MMKALKARNIAPTCQCCHLPRRGVLLDISAQTGDHLFDLRVERIHLFAGFDCDELGKVAIHSP